MHTAYDFGKEDEQRIVYVREVPVGELPAEMQVQADGAQTLYAVHSADGERLAVVKERNLAFVLARQNNFDPVTVH